jgi:hypothetical protein
MASIRPANALPDATDNVYVSSGSGDPVDSAVEMSDVSVLSGTVICI